MNDPILQKLAELPDDIQTIIDIGTNTGREIPYLKQRWPASKIIAVEPNPEPFKVMQEIPGIVPWRVAVGSRIHNALFYPSCRRSDRPHTGSSSLRQPKEHLTINPDVTFGEPFQVPVITIDYLCRSSMIDSIDLLWMDAQGCEGDIIAGSQSIIQERTRFIYTESYENEMYDGQMKRAQLFSALKNFAQIPLDDPYNILLKNDHAW